MLPSYQVCNGLANQLLGHAAYISQSIKNKSSLVRIPDVFIVNGVQNEFDGQRGLKTVFPNIKNSVPLSAIFDTEKLHHMIEKYGTQACFVPYEEAVSFSHDLDECPWLDQLNQSDDELSLQVLNALKPSVSFMRVVQTTLENLLNHLQISNFSLSEGICLHHRNGLDWQNHCRKWNGNNCLENEGRSVADLVSERIPSEYRKKWIYYIGDRDPDEKLLFEVEGHGLKLIHRDKHQLLEVEPLHHFLGALGIGQTTKKNYRDILATIDFFLCDQIDSFIGNSVSTFSALQIAKRAGKNTSWYNSRSIPLAAMFDVFYIPIIYTYTDSSHTLGKYLLKTSILSARSVFELSIDIHVIYHGFDDVEFLSWLKNHDVIVHNHKPRWSSTIEKMRVSAQSAESQSHLFSHSGNYLGTWQRIDIPLFVNAEYALLLDSDTVVRSRFSLADFGSDITEGIALSSEISETTLLPSNAGVVLMNIPRLRRTYDSFYAFIHGHVSTQFMMGPSDQGAYLDFYGNAQNALSSREFYKNLDQNKGSYALSFLDPKFNFKPYYTLKKSLKDRKITHFHGLKPHDLLSYMLGKGSSEFPSVMKPLLEMLGSRKCAESVCASLRDFGLANVSDEENLKIYCDTAFSGMGHDNDFCYSFFTLLQLLPELDCFSLGHIWKYPSGRHSMKDVNELKLLA
ncbi:hypothetical protein ACHAXR_004175 [Thalassiosira sp. AJA248-18]